MNFATVGTSWITESFIEASALAGDAEVKAVYSRSLQKGRRLADKFGIRTVYTSFDSLLNDDTIDCVYIASPNSLHYEQSKKCLLSGKSVLCEKPAAVTPKELKELYEIAEGRGLIFLEAMKSIHASSLPILREEIKTLGNITTAFLDFSQLSSKYPAYLKGENPNVFNPEFCSGGLMDLGIYPVYLAAELFGRPKKIISHCDFLKSGADFAGTLIFVYGGITVTVSYSKTANGYTGSRILGDRGAILIKSVSNLTGVTKIRGDGKTRELFPEIDEKIVMSEEIYNFIDFAKGERLEYYDYCRAVSEMVSEILEDVRRGNNFRF